MPTVSPANAASSDRIRRRRVTTACTTCRDRRVKCDRTRPACTQCKTVGRRCKYVDQDAQKVVFVNDPRFRVTGSERASTPPSSDTWGSVIQNQAGILKKAENGNDSIPVWAVAEAEEPSRPHIFQRHELVCRPYTIPVGALGEKFAHALTNHFPSREICQPFFESFLLGIQPIIPVCHIPTLQRYYKEFWESISPSYSVESLALILAVLYTGAANMSPVDILNSSTLLRLYEEIFCMVDFASYHARNVPASIQLLQGYIIMNTYKASHLAPFSAFGFLPEVIRFAQSLRLHVEMKTGDESELEVRRRIWWHLLFLDVESTVATGLPCIIHRTGFTTHFPSVLQDSAIQATVDSVSAPYSLSPMMVAMQGHYQWAHRMQTWFESLPSKDDVSQFKSTIENLLSLLPDNSDRENDWPRIYLKMQVDHAFCMLGLRFWQLDQYKGTGCNSEVVETSRSFLAHYVQLSTLSAAPHFVWFIPGLIQPLHALIILLMHLSTCTNIDEEERRSRCLLDQVMSLRVNWILNGSVVPTKALLRGDNCPQRANPRYLILVNLRKRVWKKLGWETDGKGVDPWSGRFVQGEVVGGGDEETTPNMVEKVEIVNGDGLVTDNWSGDHPFDESTGLEGLDNILAGDPMDMFQWDEWEALASEFFAS